MEETPKDPFIVHATVKTAEQTYSTSYKMTVYMILSYPGEQDHVCKVGGGQDWSFCSCNAVIHCFSPWKNAALCFQSIPKTILHYCKWIYYKLQRACTEQVYWEY